MSSAWEKALPEKYGVQERLQPNPCCASIRGGCFEKGARMLVTSAFL